MVDIDSTVSADTEQEVPETPTVSADTPQITEPVDETSVAQDIAVSGPAVGAVNFLKETSDVANFLSNDLMSEAADWIGANVFDIGSLAVNKDKQVVWGQAAQAISDAKDQGLVKGTPEFNTFVNDRVQNVVELTPPLGVGGEISASITQFVLGLAGVKKITEPIELVSKASTKVGVAAKTLVQGSAAEVLAFDSMETRLSNVLVENDILDTAFTRYLAANPDDSSAEAVFKQVVEGAVTNLAVDSIVLAAKAVRAYKRGDPNAFKLFQEASDAGVNTSTIISNQTEDNILKLAQSLNIQQKGYADAASLTGAERKAARKQARVDADEVLPEADQVALKEAGRGVVIPQTKTLEDAKANVRAIIARNGGDALKAGDEFMALHGDRASQILVTASTLADKALDNLINVSLPAYRRGELSFDELSDIQSKTSSLVNYARGNISETGRALNIVKTLDTRDVKPLNMMLDDLERLGSDPIAAKALLVNHNKHYGLIKAAWDKGIAVSNELFINAILSGPWTHYINVGSNAFVMATAPIERFMGAFIRLDTKEMRKAAYMYEGFAMGLKGSLKGSVDSLLAGKTLLDTRQSTIENMGSGNAISGAPILNEAGEIINLPTRFLTIQDELFKQLNFRMSAHAEAAADAELKGFKSLKERQAYIASRVEAAIESQLKASLEGKSLPDDPIAKVGITSGREKTFTNELTGLGKSIQGFVNKYPSLRQVAPFIRTPVNLWSYFLQRSPFVFLSPTGLRNLSSSNPQLKAEATARVTLGSALAAIYYIEAQEGTFVGGLEHLNRDELKTLKETTGIRPNSYYNSDTNTYEDMSRMSPFTDLPAIMATIHELNQYGYADEADDMFFAVTQVIAGYAKDKTFLRGVSDAMRAFDFTDGKNIGGNVNKWAQDRTAAMVPFSSLLKFTNNDPHLREVLEWGNNFKKNIPGLSKDLNPIRNWLGEPVSPDSFHTIEMMDIDFPAPLKISEGKTDPLAQEWIRAYKEGKPHSISKLPKKVGGVNLESKLFKVNQEGGKINPDRPNQTAYDQWGELLATSKYDYILDWKDSRKSKTRFQGTLREILTSVVDSPMYKEGQTVDIRFSYGDDETVISGTKETILQEVTTAIRGYAFTQLVGYNPFEQRGGKYSGKAFTVVDERGLIKGFKDPRTKAQKEKMDKADVVNMSYVFPKNPVLAKVYWNLTQAGKVNKTPQGSQSLQENKGALEELMSGNGRFPKGSN